MAGDKKTILDVVKEVEKSPYEYMDSTGFGKTISGGRLHERVEKAEALKEKAIPGLVKRALSEKDPTAGGTYEGSVYYSNILPKGKGDIPWTKEAANIVEKASQYGAKKSDILAAQNYFAKIGYMHHSEVDGMPGRQFRGMVSRWNKNATKSTDAIFDAMETWRDNIFGGDEE